MAEGRRERYERKRAGERSRRERGRNREEKGEQNRDMARVEESVRARGGRVKFRRPGWGEMACV